jgi:hypothetical protein
LGFAILINAAPQRGVVASHLLKPFKPLAAGGWAKTRHLARARRNEIKMFIAELRLQITALFEARDRVAHHPVTEMPLSHAQQI